MYYVTKSEWLGKRKGKLKENDDSKKPIEDIVLNLRASESKWRAKFKKFVFICTWDVKPIFSMYVCFNSCLGNKWFSFSVPVIIVALRVREMAILVSHSHSLNSIDSVFSTVISRPRTNFIFLYIHIHIPCVHACTFFSLCLHFYVKFASFIPWKSIWNTYSICKWCHSSPRTPSRYYDTSTHILMPKILWFI